jgi:serine phosphatase RsbU (regulator of sigma subunit)
MCTLIYAELNLPERVLRFASAGHPPPLIVVPDQEEPHFAWGGRSTPLDAYGSDGVRDDVTEPLPQGGMVLLYTDGLIEQRSRSLDVGMESLCRAVAANRSTTMSGMLARLSRELPDSPRGDDVCVLAARLAPD